MTAAFACSSSMNDAAIIPVADIMAGADFISAVDDDMPAASISAI